MSVAAAPAPVAAPPSPPLDLHSRLELRPLSFVEQRDDVLVGSVETGVFLAVPQVGAVALRVLAGGGDVGDATKAASRYSGEPVDVVAFAGALVDAGLVLTIDGEPTASSGGGRPRRARLDRLSPAVVRPLFSATAWLLYGTLFASCIVLFAAQPQFWPSFEDLFFYPNPAVVVVGMIGTSILLAFCHEVAHWLASRAAGIRPRFAISLRWFFPVFETDVSELWSLPPRQRYSPFLAGMAWDTLVLSIFLALRVAWSHGHLDLPPLLVRFAGLVVVLEVLALSWQALVFLRTDLYAVLVTRLGCLNLYAVSYLVLRRRLGLLGERGAAELAEAHPRDERAAAWFALLTLAGMAWAAWFFVAFFAPGTIVVVGWTLESIGGASPGSAVFWQAIAIAAVSIFQTLLPIAIFCSQRAARRRSAA